MQTSDNIDKIAPAFVKAQGEFGKATKDSVNPFFNSKYADLNAYLDGAAEGLKNNGLAIMQDTFSPDDQQIIKVTTTLLHSSGQWFKSEPLVLHPTDMKPQSFGSAQTYARRYSLAAMLGLGAEDDDGNKASKDKPKQKTKAPDKPKQKTKAPDKPIPERIKVFDALTNCKTTEAFSQLQKGFEKKFGKIWDQSTGVDGETWQILFTKTGDKLLAQMDFEKASKKCESAETYNKIKSVMDQNPDLQTKENREIMDSLDLAWGAS